MHGLPATSKEVARGSLVMDDDRLSPVDLRQLPTSALFPGECS
jgi:hypothetical protein